MENIASHKIAKEKTVTVGSLLDGLVTVKQYFNETNDHVATEVFLSPENKNEWVDKKGIMSIRISNRGAVECARIGTFSEKIKSLKTGNPLTYLPTSFITFCNNNSDFLNDLMSAVENHFEEINNFVKMINQK